MNTLLHSYLKSEDRESVETSLGELMETGALPIIRRVVSARLAGLWDDIDDVCSEARLELLLHLRRIKSPDSERNIADFSAYVATIAANACNQYFRRRRPGRVRLKKQIRFLVSHEPEFTIRTSADGHGWCDLAVRTEHRTSAMSINELESRIEGDRDLQRLLTQILDRAGGALELNTLVDLVARLWHIPADLVTPLSGVPPDSLAAPGVEPELAIDSRRFVVRLWEEIRRLPRSQRVSLLLNLRDHRGNSVLFLFPLCGVASFGQIASVLEIQEDRLAEIWNRLPADDQSIAELLSCARQRVINLRMSARKRLKNRRGAFR